MVAVYDLSTRVGGVAGSWLWPSLVLVAIWEWRSLALPLCPSALQILTWEQSSGRRAQVSSLTRKIKQAGDAVCIRVSASSCFLPVYLFHPACPYVIAVFIPISTIYFLASSVEFSFMDFFIWKAELLWEGERGVLWGGLLPTWPRLTELGQIEAETGTSIQVFHVGGRGPSFGAILHYFPRPLAGSWVRSGIAWTWTGALMAYQHCMRQLNLPPTTSASAYLVRSTWLFQFSLVTGVIYYVPLCRAFSLIMTSHFRGNECLIVFP